MLQVPGWKRLLGTNALAYLVSVTDKRKRKFLLNTDTWLAGSNSPGITSTSRLTLSDVSTSSRPLMAATEAASSSLIKYLALLAESLFLVTSETEFPAWSQCYKTFFSPSSPILGTNDLWIVYLYTCKKR
jgi:hypothetical protein